MNSETNNDFDQDAAVEIEESELEHIAALRVRSGLQAGLKRGLSPCI